MTVVHGGILADNFYLWGEGGGGNPAPSAQAKRRAGTRKKKTAGEAAPLPWGSGRRELAAALGAAGLTAPGEDAFQEPVVWLPTLAGQAIASTPLVAPPPAGEGEPVLAPWRVTARRLAPGEALAFLGACGKDKMLAPGVWRGDDLAFWSRVADLAVSLAARQRFLPGLEEVASAARSAQARAGGTRFRAAWLPVATGEDERCLAGLAAACPGVCRALAGVSDAPPEVPARLLLTRVTAILLDALARAAWGRRGGGRTAGATLHDRWLHALGTPDGELAGEPAELAALAARVRDWAAPLRLVEDAAFRVSFRLEEPPEDAGGGASAAKGSSLPALGDGEWRLTYMLQARDDPSLLVPAAQVWEGKGARESLGRPPGVAREKLLAGLARAGGLFPPVEESLRANRPAGCVLDAAGALRFLTEGAFLLEGVGFGVLLPSWWTGKGTRLRLASRASVRSPSAAGAGLGGDTLVDVDWQVALGDEALSLPELEALARAKAPLVKVRGQWLQAGQADIQAAIDFLRRPPGGRMALGEAVRLALGSGSGKESGLPLEAGRGEGWVADLLERLRGGAAAATAEEEPPAGLTGELRPYQRRGYAWLSLLSSLGLGACLADDMGLGKTIQTLALVQRDWEAKGPGPVLLVCPTSVLANWEKEAGRFTPRLPVLVHHGADRERGEDFRREAEAQAMVVSSYALLVRDRDLLAQVSWRGVILDEAQNVKNPDSKQAQAARSLPAGYRVALTGTPVENHVGELWSLMEFLNPGFLGNRADFNRRYFLPIQRSRDAEAAQGLRRRTGPFILRRLKTDAGVIADLPAKLEMKVFCTLTREQASLYAAVLRDLEDAMREAEGIRRKGVVLAAVTRLKQVCNHPAQFLGDGSSLAGRSGKLSRLGEMLEEVLEAGERALIFTQFAQMGEMLRGHLQETFGREVLFLHGGVARRERERMVERFQETQPGKQAPPIFILSLRAGGTGLNLTAANHVFHYDRWWNPAVENQATDRAYRIGQRKNVQVHKFVCAGTLEEKIASLIESKVELANQVVGGGEGWLTELADEDLRRVLALDREAALGGD